MATFREQLLKTHLQAYHKVRGEIRKRVGSEKEVDRYSRDYHRHTRSFASLSTQTELYRRIKASRIVYHGDYHTLRQSQQAIITIIRHCARNRLLVLCLEMFRASDQRLIDRFLNDDITEKRFLRKIKYLRTWGYNWQYWRPLLSLCREFRIPVIGINGEDDDNRLSLAERDGAAAKIVAKTVIRYPMRCVCVVSGDYHISPNRLPRRVNSLLALFDMEVRHTIVYQNVDRIYWTLARRGREDTDVVRIDDRSFCILNTTPINKHQSFLNWIEFAGDAYYPLTAHWKEIPEESGVRSIPALVQTLCTVLDIHYPKQAIDRLTLLYGADYSIMSILRSRRQFARLLPQIKEKMRNAEGFLLEDPTGDPPEYIIYLPNSRLTMAAEEAMHFLHAVLRGPLPASSSPFDRFYRNVITECIGFFGSKLINAKRESHSVHGIRTFLGRSRHSKPTPLQKRIIPVCRNVLRHALLERQTQSPDRFRRTFGARYAGRSALPGLFSTQLGYVLGERLYHAVKHERFPIPGVRELMRNPLSGPGEPFSVYMSLAARLRTVSKHRKKSA